MKEFKIAGTDVEFWQEAGMLFCRVIEMGADVYCCGNRPLPQTQEEAQALAENAKDVWLW